MRKRLYKALAATLLMTLPLTAHAQKDDFGMWFSAGVEKELSKKWDIGAGVEYRMNDNMSATDRISVGVDAKYKVTKWLKASAGYDYLHSREPQETSDGGKYLYSTYWYPRHRVHADITASHKFGRLKVSLRERWQYTYRPSFDRNRMNIEENGPEYGIISSKDKKGKGENVLRSRLNVEYDIAKCKFTPFAAAEMFNSWATQKVRYTIGTAYKIDKKNSVELYYLFEDKASRSSDDAVIDCHIVGMEYSYSF